MWCSLILYLYVLEWIICDSSANLLFFLWQQLISVEVDHVAKANCATGVLVYKKQYKVQPVRPSKSSTPSCRDSVCLAACSLEFGRSVVFGIRATLSKINLLSAPYFRNYATTQQNCVDMVKILVRSWSLKTRPRLGYDGSWTSQRPAELLVAAIHWFGSWSYSRHKDICKHREHLSVLSLWLTS